MNASTDIAYFEALYRSDPDPWRVADRWYECRKRDLLLAMLPNARYHRAFEPACGTGALTRALAARCGTVWASDASAVSVAIAAKALAHLRNVHVCQQQLPDQWPDGQFDLIVISEWAYYVSCDALTALAGLCRNSLTEGGTLIACHWRHEFSERLHSTEAVHAAFDAAAGAATGWHRLARHDEQDFQIDVWSTSPQSSAQKEGLA